MLFKLNTYWEFSIEVAQICKILDPRQKKDIIQSNKEKNKAVENLEKIYQNYKELNLTSNQATENKKKPSKSILGRFFNQIWEQAIQRKKMRKKNILKNLGYRLVKRIKIF